MVGKVESSGGGSSRWVDENPRLQSGLLGALNDRVETIARPKSIYQLFTENNFAIPGWQNNFAKRTDKYLYIEGVGVALRIFQHDSARFLKEERFFDEAIKQAELKREGSWSCQSGVTLDKPVSLIRAGEIEAGTPHNLQVLIVFIMALELALEEYSIGISKYWVYDYIRLRPAVYNIKQFYPNKLKKLRDRFRHFDECAIAYCRQDSADFLDELSKGCTATYKTVFLLKEYIDKVADNDDLKVQEIVSEPQLRGAVQSKACKNEYL